MINDRFCHSIVLIRFAASQPFIRGNPMSSSTTSYSEAWTFSRALGELSQVSTVPLEQCHLVAARFDRRYGTVPKTEKSCPPNSFCLI